MSCDNLAFYAATVRIRMAYYGPGVSVIQIALALGAMTQTTASVFAGMDPSWLKVLVVFVLMPAIFTVLCMMADSCMRLALDGMSNPPLIITRTHLIVGGGLDDKLVDKVLVLGLELLPLCVGTLSYLIDSHGEGQSFSDFISGFVEGGLYYCALLCIAGAVCRRRTFGKDAEYDAKVKELSSRPFGEGVFCGGAAMREMLAVSTSDAEKPETPTYPEQQPSTDDLASRNTAMVLAAAGILIEVLLAILVHEGVLGFWTAMPILCVAMMLKSWMAPTVTNRVMVRILVVFFLVIAVGLASFAAGTMSLPSEERHPLLLPPNSTRESFHEDFSDDMYPICHMRWGDPSLDRKKQLSVLDLTAISEMTYLETQEEMESRLHLFTDGTDLSDCSLLDVAENREMVGRWAVIRCPEIKTDVFAIRGTDTNQDVFADVDMFCSVSVMQLFNRLFPFMTLFPQRAIRRILALLVVNNWFGEESAWEPHLREAQKLKEKSQADGYETVVTGHSLGGVIAAIVASRISLPTLAISPPGTLFSAARFDTNFENCQEYLTIVQPNKDLVPTVDHQVGFVQHIACDKSTFDCHKLVTTLETLYLTCGDARGRNAGIQFAEEAASRLAERQEELRQSRHDSHDHHGSHDSHDGEEAHDH